MDDKERLDRVNANEYVTITDRRNPEYMQYWSERGRYSRSKSKYGEGHFTLTVEAETEDEWVENALAGNELTTTSSRPLPLVKALGVIPKSQFGIVFKHKDEFGVMRDKWPRIARIDEKTKDGKETIAGKFPVRVALAFSLDSLYGTSAASRPQGQPTECGVYGCCIGVQVICVGSELTMINGEPAPKTFAEAKGMLGQLPLTLEFTKAVAEASYSVPAWLRAGLAEIELVHKHEMSVLHLHEKHSPCCPERAKHYPELKKLSSGRFRSLKPVSSYAWQQFACKFLCH